MGWRGEKHVIARGTRDYPDAIDMIRNAPDRLYVVGNPEALQEGLAVVGARRATPYGLSCAERFASAAAARGIAIISGGARGCDTRSHEAAIANDAPTVVFLGGGCDRPYPNENRNLFQKVIDSGGALVSEHDWLEEPKPWMFRERNRLIAGLARATLIVEAGLPSGTFSTADEAIAANREVLVVPGAITSKSSRGANRLIYQGATPIVDDEVFSDQLDAIFGSNAAPPKNQESASDSDDRTKALREALAAEPLSVDEMLPIARLCFEDGDAMRALMIWLAEEQASRRIARFPDGRYGSLA